MYKILNDDDIYFFPNGKKYTGFEIKNMENYRMLSDSNNYGVDIQGSTIIGNNSNQSAKCFRSCGPDHGHVLHRRSGA